MSKCITYRNLLDAIYRAEELQQVYEDAASNRARWKGMLEEQDRAEARLREADEALNNEVWEFYD